MTSPIQNLKQLQLRLWQKTERFETWIGTGKIPETSNTAFLMLLCAYPLVGWLYFIEPSFGLLLLALGVGVASGVVLAPAALIADYIRLTGQKEAGSEVEIGTITLGFLSGMAVVIPGTRLIAAAESFRLFDVSMALTVGSVAAYYLLAPVEEGLTLLATYAVGSDTGRSLTPVGYAVVGAFVGLGFGYGENILYTVTQGVLGRGGILEVLLGRAPVGSLHVVVSSLGGYYLGLAKGKDDPRVLARGFCLIAFLHATHNSLVVAFASPNGLTTGGTALKAIGGFILIGFFTLTGGIASMKIKDRSIENAVGNLKTRTAPDGGKAD